jgi:hypothetical protein
VNVADEFLQAYVFAKYNFGAYSTAVEATQMSNYWCFGTIQTLPFLNMSPYYYFGPTP